MISTRQVQSEVLLKDGGAVLLGGMRREETVHTEDRVPVLGAIPVIGALFTRTQHETQETDLYVIVRAERVKPGNE